MLIRMGLLSIPGFIINPQFQYYKHIVMSVEKLVQKVSYLYTEGGGGGQRYLKKKK